MHGLSVALRGKSACRQYICDVRRRDSRSGARARLIRRVFMCLLSAVVASRHGVDRRSGVGGLTMRNARECMYFALGKLEHMSNTDDRCPWCR